MEQKMSVLTIGQEEIKKLKSRGWLYNKGTDAFSARIITVNGKVNSKQLVAVAEAAEKYGVGQITFTSRQTMEVLGVSLSKIDDFEKIISAAGLSIGGTGPKVRPITACKGTVCPRGLIDTFSLSEKIHHEYYVKWHDVQLPGKFKIGVGGCPNNCIKPDLNDLGVIGTVASDGTHAFKISLGGHWGKSGAPGTFLSMLFFSEEEVLEYIGKVLSFYRDNGESGERFFKTLARIGFDKAVEMIG
jgi:dissimilatory sulfite reductase (desulfoviridin) alpha/beta subunit